MKFWTVTKRLTHGSKLYGHMWGTQKNILLRFNVTLYAHFLLCHKMYLRLLGCVWTKVTPHAVSIELTLSTYLWYDSSSCPVGWVGNYRTAVNELCRLGQSLLCRKGLCQASSHHAERSGGITVTHAIVNRIRRVLHSLLTAIRCNSSP
jgi:hypothetical protein